MATFTSSQRRPAAEAPDWGFLNLILLDHEHLPVVLARMGLRVVAALPTPEWWSAPGPVLLLAPAAEDGPHLYVDASGVAGWRDGENIRRGADIASLGAVRWGCRYGQAAWRLARLCGLDGLPKREVRRHGR